MGDVEVMRAGVHACVHTTQHNIEK